MIRYRVFGHEWLVVMILLLSSAPMIASAQTRDWFPELLPPDTSYRTAVEAVRIRLPDDLPDEVLQVLSLEMDAIDITRMVVLDGDTVVYTPVQNLTFGLHALRLVEYARDGNIIERGNWTLDVRQSADWQMNTADANISYTASRRIKSKNLGDKPRGFTRQGSADFSSTLSDTNLRFDSTANFIYNNRSELTANNRELDLGQYLVTMDTKHSELRLGHHDMQDTSLILDNFNRRGFSGKLHFDNLNSSVTGFAMRTDQITGIKNTPGMTDPDKRVEGVTVNTQVLDTAANALDLSVSYLTGEGSEGGVNVGTFNESNSGNAWSLVANSTHLSEQLALRGEYASTEFDFDGDDTGYSAEDDDAYSLLAVYTPTSDSITNPKNWSIGAEHSKVGTYFKSLANTNLPADRTMTRLFLSLNQAAWFMDTSLARETDNVDDDSLLPTTETDYGYLTLTYNPAEPVPEDSFFSWLGTPSHTMAASITKQEHTDVPRAYDGALADTRTDSLQLQSTFNHAAWNWAAGLGWSRFRDSENLSPDSNTYTGDLSAGFPAGERFYISPMVQYQVTKDEGSSEKQSAINWGATANVNFIPNKLTGNFNFTLNRNKTSGAGSSANLDTTSKTFSGDLVWAWIPPKTNRPGFDISLNGTWQDTDEKATRALTNEAYQVFLNLTVTMPVAYPGRL